MSTAAGSRTTQPSSLAGEIVRERVWSIAIWTAMVGWSAVLFVISRDAYATFRTGRFDLGNMVQAVWSTAHGHPLEVTHGAGEQIIRLGSHVDPFLALLAPLWLVWPSPLALALSQIVVVALGALPVWWLGRRHLGSEHVAGLLALGYLAYPWVATSAVAAIHPVTFAITFYLFGVWYLDTNRLVLFGFFAALAMSTGELMGLPVLGLGIWYAIARRRRYEGAAIAAAGLAWTTIAVFAIVPRFSGDESMYFGFYDEVGGSPIGVIRTLVTDPSMVLGAVVESHDIVYVVWLGLPLLFLFALSPGLALVALPQLLANSLSDFRSMTDPRYHSVAAVIPFLIAATVFGVARIRASRRSTAAAGILVSSLVLALAIGPWVRSVGLAPLGGRESVPAERATAIRDAVALVPNDAPVSASNTAAAHLSARRYVYSIPVLRRANWVVVDRVDPWIVTPDSPILTNHPEVVEAFLRRLERDAAWQKVFDEAGVVVLRRRAAG